MVTNSEKTNWKAVFTFYILACLWSWPFFWWRDVNRESWLALDLPRFIKIWLVMWGPGVGALACFLLYKNHKRAITFQGTSLWRGIVFFTLIPISLALWNKDPKILLTGLLGFVSILGEELGWRGFLQDALKTRSDWSKAVIIGVLWEIWHFTNRTANNELFQAIKLVCIWMVLTTVLSFIAIKLTKRNQSLMVAITLHTAVNAGFEFPNGPQALLSCLPFWALLLWRWPVQNKVDESLILRLTP